MLSSLPPFILSFRFRLVRFMWVDGYIGCFLTRSFGLTSGLGPSWGGVSTKWLVGFRQHEIANLKKRWKAQVGSSVVLLTVLQPIRNERVTQCVMY